MNQALVFFPFVGLIGTALILFLSTFVLIVIWTYRKNSKERYLTISQLPIEGESHVEQ